jgi:catechol 2,3-dioxygenase-like lactoylglutathione lyase family enzyme
VNVRRLCWIGTRTENFSEMKDFCGRVLGLPVVLDEPAAAMFQLPGGEHDYLEVGGLDDPYTAYITTGPVPGFLVDDIVEAREELETAGIEIVEPVRWMADVAPALVEANPKFVGYGWFAFRAPDGNVYGCVQGSPGE